MKKIITAGLTLLLLTTMASAKLKKIAVEEDYNKSDSEKTEKITHVKDEKEQNKKLKLVQYKIRYDRSLKSFSILETDKNSYKKYMKLNDIENFTLKRMFGRTNSALAVSLSAYGYDYVYQRPDLAENFYRVGIENGKLSILDKIKFADYLLRTGRPDQISTVIKNSDCMSSFKLGKKCFYYLGVESYLKTGNNRNNYFRICKDKIPKAYKIFHKDKKKGMFMH